MYSQGKCGPAGTLDKPFLREAQSMTGRSQGYLAATACLLGFGACAAPTEHTDLRPDGPPEVLAVLASDDPAAGIESATFCKLGDDKRPGLVPAALFLQMKDQICPDDLKQGA